MTTSPLANGTRVTSVALVTLVVTAVATALVGAVIGGLGGAGTRSVGAGAPDLRAAATAGPGPGILAGSLSWEPPPAQTTTVRFSWTMHRITAAGLGASWHAGCPVAPSSLRAVTFTHWDFSGRSSTGEIVLNRSVVRRARAVFRAMYQQGFPLRLVQPVSAYAGSDADSMAADNTSGFTCRQPGGAGRPWSRHAYGTAIDVNPVENPHLSRGEVLPPAGVDHTDRSVARPGLIRRGDPIHDAFQAAGFRWGGSSSHPDYQHFER